ncbi:NAD-dependent epimerase/dehydratase family protein [Amphibiibacter pelophylacis]|uniref:NAD-dependent epimerase/dehydratase family protein n=1 Tax=Amphibiibacter pelophylacis TaxID=1799477 RepID=A0ACC6NZ53_9BURK
MTLPRRFRRRRVLIVGCGDVGQRLLRQIGRKAQVLALVRSPAKAQPLRNLGAQVLAGDLDSAASLRRLGPWLAHVIHLAPPPAQGEGDPRSQALLRALRHPGWRRKPGQAPRLSRLVYASTTGVYGDCGGALVRETRPLSPRTPRARRRVAAEALWRGWGQSVRTRYSRPAPRISVLRVPGIYAFDRASNPLDRLDDPTPLLTPQDDVWVNRIHADDLARALWLAHWRAPAGRVYHLRDQACTRQGDDLDALADATGRPRLPRVPLAELRGLTTPMRLSFLEESRRIDPARIRAELRWRPQWPDLLTAWAGR